MSPLGVWACLFQLGYGSHVPSAQALRVQSRHDHKPSSMLVRASSAANPGFFMSLTVLAPLKYLVIKSAGLSSRDTFFTVMRPFRAENLQTQVGNLQMSNLHQACPLADHFARTAVCQNTNALLELDPQNPSTLTESPSPRSRLSQQRFFLLRRRSTRLLASYHAFQQTPLHINHCLCSFWRVCTPTKSCLPTLSHELLLRTSVLPVKDVSPHANF